MNIKVNVKEKLTKINESMKEIGEFNPKWMQSFQKFIFETEKAGALSKKFKELIAVALSVKSQCDRCITWHVANALQAGATKEEILEASLVAVVMSGGPGLMYLEDVLNSIEDLNSK